VSCVHGSFHGMDVVLPFLPAKKGSSEFSYLSVKPFQVFYLEVEFSLFLVAL
jgi:hypothetical protein